MDAIYYVIIGLVVLLTLGLRSYLDRRAHGKPALETERPWRTTSNVLGIAWIAAYLAVEAIPDETNPRLVAAAITIVALLGVAGAWAACRQIAGADELTRKIETEAAALGLVVSILGFMVAEQLVDAGLIPEPGISNGLWAMFSAIIICRLSVIARYR